MHIVRNVTPLLVFAVLVVVATLPSAVLCLPAPAEAASEIGGEPERVGNDEILQLARRSVNASSCLKKIYIMAFTGGAVGNEVNLDTTDGHAVEILIKSGHVRHVLLHDLPENDYSISKGDLWKINLADFGFPTPCLIINDIEKIYIIEHSNDGWGIDSIATFLGDDQGGFQLATMDLDLNQGLDGNGNYPNTRIELTPSLLQAN